MTAGRPATGAPGTRGPGFAFVSYARDDGAYVRRLVAYLRPKGLDIWVDHEIHHGESWPQVIAAKIDACSAFIVVMSPAAEVSPWVSREIIRAQQQHKPILPILLAGMPMLQVNNIQYENVEGGRMPGTAFVEWVRSVLSNPDRPMGDGHLASGGEGATGHSDGATPMEPIHVVLPTIPVRPARQGFLDRLVARKSDEEAARRRGERSGA